MQANWYSVSDILSDTNSNVKIPDNWKELSTEELATYLPECKFKDLKPTPIINFDDVVQNCSTNIIPRYDIEGIAGANIYFYLTNQGLPVIE